MKVTSVLSSSTYALMASRRGSFVSMNLKSSLRNCLKPSSLPSFIVNVLITMNGAVMLTPLLFSRIRFGLTSVCVVWSGLRSVRVTSFLVIGRARLLGAGVNLAGHEQRTVLVLLTRPVRGHAPRFVHRQRPATRARGRRRPSLFDRKFVLAFVCPDKACSWESRESWEVHLLHFHLWETGVLYEGCQILNATSPSVKSRSLALAFLLTLEIGNDQAPPWFEHAGDFQESLTLEVIRQMMRHQSTEHHIERLIGEVEVLDHPDPEIDGQVAPSSFRAGTGDLLCARVNAEDAARCANALLDFNRQHSRAAAHIQHPFSGLNAGQVGGPLPELPQLATEQEGVDEPCHQVVAPAPVEDQPLCLFGRRLARFAVVVMCERMHRSCSFRE